MVTNTTQRRSSAEIVAQYLEFFRGRDHLMMRGSPLVVPDSSTSFVIAGMQPLLPYLRGQVTPPAPRLTALQRCLRSDDAEVVGTNGCKLTSFHMLGNWSIGDYGRHEAIALALQLLVGSFELDQRQLWVTTFGGDPAVGLAPDERAVAEWRHAGVPPERIVPLGVDDNFWTMGGPGPCGPCSEIFVDRGPGYGCGAPTCQPGCWCERFLEIWNLVFIEYEWLLSGAYVPLPLRSVDTGMGLERIAAVLQDVPSVFETDLLALAATRLEQLAPGGVGGGGARETRARRMILDHARAALLTLAEGVHPGHDGRGSVVRGLIRRAARQGRVLGLNGPFLGELMAPLAEAHGALLTPEERQRMAALAHTITDEEQRFARVLTLGLRHLARIEPDTRGLVPGEQIFVLHAERGFPAELAAEVLAERGVAVDWAGYERALEAHRAISRASADARFGSA